jgi:hypothetical protein
MEKNGNARQALQTLINYFETGTRESDAVAKAVLATESEYWQQETEHFQKSTEWTGIRAPEAELLAVALREVNRLLEKCR